MWNGMAYAMRTYPRSAPIAYMLERQESKWNLTTTTATTTAWQRDQQHGQLKYTALGAFNHASDLKRHSAFQLVVNNANDKRQLVWYGRRFSECAGIYGNGPTDWLRVYLEIERSTRTHTQPHTGRRCSTIAKAITQFDCPDSLLVPGLHSLLCSAVHICSPANMCVAVRVYILNQNLKLI